MDYDGSLRVLQTHSIYIYTKSWTKVENHPNKFWNMPLKIEMPKKFKCCPNYKIFSTNIFLKIKILKQCISKNTYLKKILRFKQFFG